MEALRTLVLEDLLARRLSTEEQDTGLWDRQGNRWLVFDVDGTRESARQRALPQTVDRPAPQRRLRPLCAPGYTGRKRGEVVRTRTTVLQAHSYQWLGSFGNAGNGQYREELRRAVATTQRYAKAQMWPEERVLVRLDGQYGTGAVLAELAGLAYVMRGKDYQLLDRPEIQTRLHLPADQQFSRPESHLVRTLYDCPDVAIGPTGQCCRVVVAMHVDGSLRLMRATLKPRRMSVLLHPLEIGSTPLLWKDWSRRQHRRACMQLLRHQRVDLHLESLGQAKPATSPPLLSRAQRAHYRLSWEERLARNTCASTAGRGTITLFGVPTGFAAWLGLSTA